MSQPTPIAAAVEAVKEAAGRVGVPELARRAKIPRTTVYGLERKGFRTAAVDKLDRLHAEALRINADPDTVA